MKKTCLKGAAYEIPLYRHVLYILQMKIKSVHKLSTRGALFYIGLKRTIYLNLLQYPIGILWMDICFIKYPLKGGRFYF